jgi:hypothetical protein
MTPYKPTIANPNVSPPKASVDAMARRRSHPELVEESDRISPRLGGG